MTRPLTDYRALTFDCYGTMIDWESGIWDALQPLLMANRRDDITRKDALAAFARIETAQELSTPEMLYPELLSHVHRTLAAQFDMRTDAELNQHFGASVPQWPAFPDSADALRILKKHFKLIILSNVHRGGFSASNRKLGVEFDAIYTAQDVGSYKPNAANFTYLLDHVRSDLGITPNQILHTAQSLHHDHVPATRAGLAKAWIDRQNLANSENWGATAIVNERPAVDFRFSTLIEMAEAIGRS
ncbi:MAG: haloacid dehalogenase type II [Gammaproteobacteria bacterium]|nr:haloacid dehalogenase type II [Gammaproteobacteria bacterium]